MGTWGRGALCRGTWGRGPGVWKISVTEFVVVEPLLWELEVQQFGVRKLWAWSIG